MTELVHTGERRDAGRGAARRLAHRAKAAGRPSPDFVLDHLVLMVTADAGVQATSPAARAAASRRFAAPVIQTFRGSRTHSPLPPAAPQASAAPLAYT
ncbi:hypothetical protein N8I84_33785 [Streptomyces cynarae]|uniref:Uncharacterized protein n=1 Tax=Streptomyces cynarae TaxID=2981134 RepID=A0ABY6E9N9_9ACTN|nr:hypothetical protein [Streptomyces cynarae]UXY23118.1 hypothetical protein N8I84_33785 [Streptomyces cynarae]